MWKLLAKLRYVAYLAGAVAVAMHFGGTGQGASGASKPPKSPYARFYGMTSQHGKAWTEVARNRVHSVNLDVHLRCTHGVAATSRLVFVDRGPHGLRLRGHGFESHWTKGGLTADVKGRLTNHGTGGRLVHGTIAVSGRFAGESCRSGSIRFAASPAPLVRLRPRSAS